MSIKTKLAELFKRQRKQQIVITFTDNLNGRITTDFKADKNIPVFYAANAIDKLKKDIGDGLANKLHKTGFKGNDPNRRAFIRKQTLGDILK